MLEPDVLIIGGGIAGSYLASQIPESINSVILDQKETMRKDSCSGIVSKRIENLISTETVNKVKIEELSKVKVSIGGQTTSLDNETYVLDRNQLNSILLGRAEQTGTKLLLGDKAASIDERGGSKQKPARPTVASQKRQFKPKLVVDCSGASAFTLSQLNLEQSIKRYQSGTVRVSREKVNTEKVDYSRVFYKKRYSSTHFAWILPRGPEIEYGVIGTPSGLKQFLSDQGVSVAAEKFRFDKLQLGQVETCSNRLLLLGESACQNKPITGGGIVYGMICANCALEAIKKSLNNSKFTKNYLEEIYRDLWRSKINKSIQLQLKLQSILEKIDFSRTQLPEIELEADYDLLF